MTDQERLMKDRRCNRSACRAEHSGVWWWNTSTRAYYCQPCAFKINDANPGLCIRADDTASPSIFSIVGRPPTTDEIRRISMHEGLHLSYSPRDDANDANYVKFVRGTAKVLGLKELRERIPLTPRTDYVLIDALNAETNDGRGSSVAKTCADLLRRGEQRAAQTVWVTDADKVRQYPEMFELLTTILGPDLSSSWGMAEDREVNSMLNPALPEGVYLVSEDKDGIVVGFDFGHAGGESPATIVHAGATYRRGLLECIPLELASTYCSLRRYDR